MLLSIAQGDENSFRTIYDHYRARIFAYAVRLMDTEDAAEEVMQEVFIKVWLNRRELAELEQFGTWLYRVARNTMFDAFRKSERRKTIIAKVGSSSTSISQIDADTWLLDKENQVWLKDALQQLTPSQKKVFQLSRQQGLKAEEIARELNISVNTVKKHLVDSLQSLRHYLQKHKQILTIIAAETLVATA